MLLLTYLLDDLNNLSEESPPSLG